MKKCRYVFMHFAALASVFAMLVFTGCSKSSDKAVSAVTPDGRIYIKGK